MELPEGYVNGSPDGPRMIFGKENINWTPNPKQQVSHHHTPTLENLSLIGDTSYDVQGDVASIMKALDTIPGELSQKIYTLAQYEEFLPGEDLEVVGNHENPITREPVLHIHSLDGNNTYLLQSSGTTAELYEADVTVLTEEVMVTAPRMKIPCSQQIAATLESYLPDQGIQQRDNGGYPLDLKHMSRSTPNPLRARLLDHQLLLDETLPGYDCHGFSGGAGENAVAYSVIVPTTDGDEAEFLLLEHYRAGARNREQLIPGKFAYYPAHQSIAAVNRKSLAQIRVSTGEVKLVEQERWSATRRLV